MSIIRVQKSACCWSNSWAAAGGGLDVNYQQQRHVQSYNSTRFIASAVPTQPPQWRLLFQHHSIVDARRHQWKIGRIWSRAEQEGDIQASWGSFTPGCVALPCGAVPRGATVRVITVNCVGQTQWNHSRPMMSDARTVGGSETDVASVERQQTAAETLSDWQTDGSNDWTRTTVIVQGLGTLVSGWTVDLQNRLGL